MRAAFFYVVPLLVIALAANEVRARPVIAGPRHHASVAHRSAVPTEDEPSKKSLDDAAPMAPYTVRFTHTFFHVHTRELFPVARITDETERAHFLRCRLTGAEHEMAREPFGVALALADRFGVDRIEVVSGFRSPKLNETLRKKGHEVASDSQHTHGNALDFRLPGVPAVQLAQAAGEIHVGGIGTYRESDFVHVDTGRVRRWNGH